MGVVPVESHVYWKAFTENPEYFRNTWRTMQDFIGEARASNPQSFNTVNFREWFGLFGAADSRMGDIYPGKYSK
jgi:hypothetical protein